MCKWRWRSNGSFLRVLFVTETGNHPQLNFESQLRKKNKFAHRSSPNFIHWITTKNDLNIKKRVVVSMNFQADNREKKGILNKIYCGSKFTFFKIIFRLISFRHTQMLFKNHANVRFSSDTFAYYVILATNKSVCKLINVNGSSEFLWFAHVSFPSYRS